MNRSYRTWLPVGACLLLVLARGGTARAAGHGGTEPGFPARVELGGEQPDVDLLAELGIDIDGVFDGWARVYLIAEERDKLQRLGFRVTPLPDEGRAGLARLALEGIAGPSAAPAASQYHDYASLTAALQAIASEHSDIVRLSSIGQSVQGRELWMVKITDNPDVEEDEPGFVYISSMHGDEVVGKEMCLYLIDLLTDTYGSNARSTALVDETEIWILPSMNPDGTALGQRWNANGYDLNRDFPDQFVDPVNTTAGRQPETAAVMNWGFAHTTALSSNFHGGALVANYPWDSNPANAAVYSASPDDAVFVSLARSYADNNPPMAASNSSSSFDNGITNGADWYPIWGGLQDWNYIWRGALEVLVELSQQKWPAASTLPTFWGQNRESLLAYMERVHEGVRGIVTDAATGAPLAAQVAIEGNPHAAHTDPEVGDYHRVLLPGTYTLEVSAVGYSTRLVRDVVVAPGPATRIDVALEPLAVDLEPAWACADGAGDCRAWLPAAAASDVVVTLVNLGLAASGVQADLVPTGWHAAVTRAAASYPDLGPGELGDAAPPYHQVTLAEDVPAGHKAGFALRFHSDQGGGLSEPFFLPVGDASCVTTASGGVGLPIADHQTTTSDIDVGAALELAEVRVGVNLTHTYVGELRVDVVSPAGTPIALHARAGGSSDNIVGTFGLDLPTFEPLSRLAGESSAGTWQLRVRDSAGGDVGTLVNWSVETCGRTFESAVPEMRFREIVREAGAVRLHWWSYPGLTSYRVYRSTDPTSAAAFVDVTAEDADSADTQFADASDDPMLFWLVTGVGPQGEGPLGHSGP